MKSSNHQHSYLAYFLIVLAFELLFWALLVFGHRMPIGHDGFEMLCQQWFFVNSAISHHEFPLWSPYLNHGTPVWWYFIYSRMEIFFNTVMLFSPWIKGGNFLVYFYGSIFFDKFILLCGVWLLSRRYFNSPLTAFFVSATVMATTIAYTQNSFSLVLFYVLPLMIYLLHRFFDTKSWKWLLLALFLLCTVSINVFYFISVITLAVFVFFWAVACESRGTIFKDIKVQAKDIFWMGGIFALLLVFAAIYILGHDPAIVITTIQRQADGGVPIDVFLGYGGDNNFLKWWELFIGISLRWDYTLYMGLMCVPLCVIGIFFSKNANKKFFIWGAFFFLLFGCATPISAAAYYCWPLMKAFRHIGLVAPLIKLYLCFLAGFGFERLFDSEEDQEQGSIYKMSMIASAILLLNWMFLSQLIADQTLTTYLLRALGPDIQNRVSVASIADYFFNLAILSLLGSLIFFLRPYIKFPKYASSYLIIFMVFHLLMVYWYAYDEVQLRTFPLTNAQYHLMDFRQIPYQLRRSVDDRNNPRHLIMQGMQGLVPNTLDNFTFDDLLRSKQTPDFYLHPYYNLLSAFKAQERSPVLLKLAGVTQDKVQFFSTAHWAGSFEHETSKLLDKKYAGDILFYLSPWHDVVGQENLKDLYLSGNQRLNLPYKITSFSPDQIIINVNTPRKGVWLQYSDNWHPSWKAQVNGHPQEVFISSLAYKALPLQGGNNVVRFYVDSRSVEWLYDFFMLSSLAWMALLIWLLLGSAERKFNDAA